MHRTRRYAGGMCLALLCLAGCFEDTGGKLPLRGQIRCDGEPVGNGRISFGFPGKGQHLSAAIYKSRFEIPADRGLLPGEYRVEITAERPTGETYRVDEFTEEEEPVYEQFLPERYNTESELMIILEPGGKRDFDFDLSLDP